MTITKDTQFYGVCLKPYSNGVTRWAVYYADPKNPEGRLEKLWPLDPRNHKSSKAFGYTYEANRESRFPAYHFKISEIGTSHHYLLKDAIARVLRKERGIEGLENANDVNLQIL